MVGLFVVTVVVSFVTGFLIYLLERHAQGTQIRTFGQAMFWSSTQLLSVGSPLVNPLSTGGKVIDVFMEIYSITVVATLAGSLGAFFHRRGHEKDLAHKAALEAASPGSAAAA